MYGIFTYMWLIFNGKCTNPMDPMLNCRISKYRWCRSEVAEVWFFRHYGEGLLAEIAKRDPIGKGKVFQALQGQGVNLLSKLKNFGTFYDQIHLFYTSES